MLRTMNRSLGAESVSRAGTILESEQRMNRVLGRCPSDTSLVLPEAALQSVDALVLHEHTSFSRVSGER